MPKCQCPKIRAVHFQYLFLVLVALLALYQIEFSLEFSTSVSEEALLLIKQHSIDQFTSSNHRAVASRENSLTSAKSVGQESEQMIVILPGPHKTGTTSVQAALKNWVDKPPVGTQFHKWAFPILSREDWQSVEAQSDGKMFFNAKGLHPFFHSLRTTSCSDTTGANNTALVRLYSKRMQQTWDEGYNLVLASETLDLLVDENVARHNADHADQYWKRALECLPNGDLKGSQPTIVVGIQHRTPRVDHLISLWHQIGGNETLLDFATDIDVIEPRSFILNSLGLADFFAQKGYPVVILDTGGMKALNEKLELTTAVVCYFLQMPCHTNEQGELEITLTEKQRPKKASIGPAKKKNEREDAADRGINDQTLGMVNKLLMDYDCQYQRLARLENVQLLYGDNTFSHCNEETQDVEPKPMYTTIRAIAEMLCKEIPTAKNCQR